VDAFNLYKKEEDKLCEYKYQGPKLAKVNVTTSKTCMVDTMASKLCLNQHMNKFHTTQCMPVNTSLQELVQMKEDGLHFIIYCPFSNIHIMNIEEEYPEFPFRLSKQDNFSVGTFEYIGCAIEIKERLDLTVIINNL